MSSIEKHKKSGPDAAPALGIIQTSLSGEGKLPNQSAPPKYPLLEEMLALRQMVRQPTYTIRDVAKLFDVTVRSIQSRVASGQLSTRDLPGRAKFLSCDLEEYLRNSKKGGNK